MPAVRQRARLRPALGSRGKNRRARRARLDCLRAATRAVLPHRGAAERKGRRLAALHAMLLASGPEPGDRREDIPERCAVFITGSEVPGPGSPLHRTGRMLHGGRDAGGGDPDGAGTFSAWPCARPKTGPACHRPRPEAPSAPSCGQSLKLFFSQVENMAPSPCCSLENGLTCQQCHCAQA